MAVEKLPHDNDGNQLRAKVQVLVQKYIDATNRKLKADFDVSQRQFAIDQAETSLTLLKTELQTFDSDKRNADITTNAVRTQLLPIQQLLMTRFGAGGGVGVDAASVDLTAMSTTSYDLTAMSTTCDMSGVVEFDESVPVPFVSAPAAAPAPAPRGFAPVAASMPAPVPAPMPLLPCSCSSSHACTCSRPGAVRRSKRNDGVFGNDSNGLWNPDPDGTQPIARDRPIAEIGCGGNDQKIERWFLSCKPGIQGIQWRNGTAYPHYSKLEASD